MISLKERKDESRRSPRERHISDIDIHIIQDSFADGIVLTQPYWIKRERYISKWKPKNLSTRTFSYDRSLQPEEKLPTN